MNHFIKYKVKYWNVSPNVFILVYSLLVTGIIISNSSLRSEDAHFANGIYYWQNQQPDFFRVNPPLIRLCATFIPSIVTKRTDWKNITSCYHIRNEFAMGIEYCEKNSGCYRHLLLFARITCLLFGIVLFKSMYCWFRDLYYSTSIIGVLLFTFSLPMIIGNAASIIPDVHAAAIGMMAFYFFWQWLKSADTLNMLQAGLCLGLAEVCKFTLLVFYPLYIILHFPRFFAEERIYEKLLQEKRDSFVIV